MILSGQCFEGGFLLHVTLLYVMRWHGHARYFDFFVLYSSLLKNILALCLAESGFEKKKI
jgi:hypothetical protein